MIPGHVALDISSIMIVGLDQVVKAQPGEDFVGIPCGLYHDNSPPFIEVWKDGRCIRTLNLSQVAAIEFKEKPNASPTP